MLHTLLTITLLWFSLGQAYADPISAVQRELVTWVEAHGRRPMRLSKPCTAEEHVEAAVGATFNNLRARERAAPRVDAVSLKLDQVSPLTMYVDKLTL
jgi:hypothetical protein